jgi:hypothetical protein
LESNFFALQPSNDSSVCYSPLDIDANHDNPYQHTESTGSSSSESSVEYPYPPVDSDDPDTSNGAIDSPNVAAEGILQNVVSFPVAFSNAALHKVQLLKLLHEIGAPNHAFKSLMTWARKADENDYHFQPSPMCYESQIKNLTGLVGMTPCRPKITKVSLEPDDIILDVVVFPFATMLSSLLNCPMLNKLENLVVNPDDRYGRCDGECLGEVNSAQWYQDTHDRMILNPGKDFLCPIIFAMDKTVISEISHLSVNVILFSTTIFNQEVSLLFRGDQCFLHLVLIHTVLFRFCRLATKALPGVPLHIFPIRICITPFSKEKKLLLLLNNFDFSSYLVLVFNLLLMHNNLTP